ncbi:hypothetical protein DL95DRAFT_458346 [Leptodontidium sp. 2 PMI_412]|nr:hypothetical protein DL95DRAFT_458346 [Leptodontidium sp. 2 PMI_412]
MPIKVPSCGRIWHLGPDGVYFREFTLIEASLHLEETQQEMTRANELRKVEQEEAAKQQRLDFEAAQKEIDVQQEELKGKLLQAEKKLQGLDEETEIFHSREGGLARGRKSWNNLPCENKI